MLHLVKWGFSYSDIRNIPLDEVDEYIKLINEYYEERKRQQTEGLPSSPDEPKTIGQLNPSMF